MSTLTVLLALALVAAPAVALPAEDPSLLAWYTFEERAGTDIRDRSGHGRDGRLAGGSFVRSGEGFALRFASPGDHAECAPGKSFGLKDQVSLEAWVYPEAVPAGGEPGIAGQGYESFVLTYYTNGECWWYIGAGGNNCHAPLATGGWHHVVGTFDGKLLKLYVDGTLAATHLSNTATIPEGQGLLIGKQTGDPQFSQGKTFPGMVGEVRLYNRVLAADEVAVRYRTSNLTRTVDLAVFPLYFGRQIDAELSLRGLGERPAGSCARLELLPAGSRKPVRVLRAAPLGRGDKAEATMKVGDLAPGRYELRCTPLGAQGKPIGLPSAKAFEWPRRPSWPGMPRGVKVVNNLVTELLSAAPRKAASAAYTFTNPREGWVFVATAPGVSAALDGEPIAAPEAMRWLPAGEHKLRLVAPPAPRTRGEPGLPAPRTRGEQQLPARTTRGERGRPLPPSSGGRGGGILPRVVVRAIPTLGYCQFPGNPHVAPFGPYDWPFLQKHVLPHCNLIVASGTAEYRPFLEEWKRRGGKWVVHAGVPGLDGKAATADEVEKAWSENPGMAEPLADGIIVDEFGPGDQPNYTPWTEAVRRMAANPALKGKLFIPYAYGPMYGAKGSGAFIRAAFDMGSPFANERYLPEQPIEGAARHFLDASLRADAEGWNKGTPEGVRRMLMTLGYLAAPNESLDIDPGVDWRVYMDMQMQVLATDPAFFGLWGVQWYLSSYADEEQVRLAARLFRHYAIEGKTERLLKDPYVLAHLRNPDFADGLNGWAVAAAEPASIGTGSMPGFSWLEGRYPPTNRGDTFLLMKRSAARPNVVRQTVRALQPGRLYALRMFAADWKDLGRKQPLGMSVALDGVDIVPGKSFVHVINSCYSHVQGEFNAEHPAWFSYFFQVFRARGKEATLTISDWARPGEPGGPAGQEIAANFVEMQPYFADTP